MVGDELHPQFPIMFASPAIFLMTLRRDSYHALEPDGCQCSTNFISLCQILHRSAWGLHFYFAWATLRVPNKTHHKTISGREEFAKAFWRRTGWVRAYWCHSTYWQWCKWGTLYLSQGGCWSSEILMSWEFSYSTCDAQSCLWHMPNRRFSGPTQNWKR